MKNILKFIFVVIFLFNFNLNNHIQAQQNNQKISVKKVWATPDILTTSESVCYDAKRHLFYVSCINGSPLEKDNNGFIVMISETGDIITHKWLEGLNAPKGMAIYGGKLYVTDINRVVEINIEKATILKEYPFAGAKFLNDITIDSKGNVYISDMATGKIHKINNKGFPETWLINETLISPNGLFYLNEKILVGTKNGIFSINIVDKKIEHLVRDIGGIDGLKIDGKGNYIISDWSGKIQLVSAKNEPIVLLNTTESGVNAADFEFVPHKKLIVVPTFGDNRVMAYELIDGNSKK